MLPCDGEPAQAKVGVQGVGQGRQLGAHAPLRWRARSSQGRCAGGRAPCPSTWPDPQLLGPGCSAQTVLLALAYTGPTFPAKQGWPLPKMSNKCPLACLACPGSPHPTLFSCQTDALVS